VVLRGSIGRRQIEVDMFVVTSGSILSVRIVGRDPGRRLEGGLLILKGGNPTPFWLRTGDIGRG